MLFDHVKILRKSIKLYKNKIIIREFKFSESTADAELCAFQTSSFDVDKKYILKLEDNIPILKKILSHPQKCLLQNAPIQNHNACWLHATLFSILGTDRSKMLIRQLLKDNHIDSVIHGHFDSKQIEYVIKSYLYILHLLIQMYVPDIEQVVDDMYDPRINPSNLYVNSYSENLFQLDKKYYTSSDHIPVLLMNRLLHKEYNYCKIHYLEKKRV